MNRGIGKSGFRAAIATPPRCCVACGRWGTRGFREADSSDGHGEGSICENDRPCRLRREKAARLSQVVLPGDAAPRESRDDLEIYGDGATAHARPEDFKPGLRASRSA